MTELIPLFSEPLYHSKIESFDYNEVNKQISLSKFQETASGLLCVSTEEYIIDLLPNLKSNIIKHVNTYLFDKLQLNPFEYYFSDSWFVRIPPSGYANIHMHTNSLYSGVVYIDVPERGGSIKFIHRPNGSNACVKYLLGIKEYNYFNSESWVISSNKGDIIITPSYVYHEVLKNESDKDRLSFAFNILPYNYKHKGLTSRVL